MATQQAVTTSNTFPAEAVRQICLQAGAIANLIGFKLISIGPGNAMIEFEAGDRYANPLGTLHGGVLCEISDVARGMAYASTLNEGESFTRHWNLKSTSLSRSGRPNYGPKATSSMGGKRLDS